ncbi:MAG: hypothetical protein IT355_11230 [Gemmatimonadaceae bacterium]|nr:hypothetical protein [Gemmatimonadaceae bacterium]
MIRGAAIARTIGVALLLAPALAPSLRAQAPGGRCNIELTPANDSLRLTTTASTPNGPRNVFVGGRVLAKCINQDVRLLADSAEWYQQAQVLYLIGNVRYSEPRARVSSDLMTYFQADERLLATGSVEATLPSGSVMRGPQATYFRAVRGLRPAARLEAVQRPRLWLSQRDSVGKSTEPVQVTANQITTDNDSLVYAGGQVEITRSDLDARSDSAFLDSGHELARLMIKPVIIGKGERGYTLRGRQVELYTRNRVVQRVLAQAEARVTSEDLLLTSDTIDLRVDRNRAQAAFIWGASRARAVSPDRDLIADSMAVRMPDQQLREVRAFRHAVATTMPDTATVRSGEKDWLKGDTILAFFDSTARTAPARAAGAAPAPTADSARKPQLREMQAIGRASARYQVAAEGGTPERPGINYSRGDRISVVMDSGGVSRVQIDEHAVGVYLEPIRDSLTVPRAPADSASPPAPAQPPAPTAPATRPASRPPVVPPRSSQGRP